MKTNLRLSSKMHLFIIISCVLIALGLAVGTICHFVSNGFFNYSAEWGNYKSITVNYEDIDFRGMVEGEPEDVIDDLCSEAFKEAGVSSYETIYGDKLGGGRISYKFSYSANDDGLNKAVELINAKIADIGDNAEGQFSYPAANKGETVMGGGKAVSMAAIAIAVAVALHCIYFAIRYKLTMALGALIADVHNFGLFVAIVALVRVPVGISILAYAVLTVLLSVIGTSYLFDRMRKNFKDEDLNKLTATELVDRSADESFTFNTLMPACLAAVSILVFVFMSISSLSPLAIISPVLCSLLSAIVCAYGTAMFTPAVYTPFKLMSDNRKNKARAKKAKNK